MAGHAWYAMLPKAPLSCYPKREAVRTVSEVLVDQMAEWGIKYVFGIPGTSALGLVDAVRKNGRLAYIQVRHEQTAYGGNVQLALSQGFYFFAFTGYFQWIV